MTLYEERKADFRRPPDSNQNVYYNFSDIIDTLPKEVPDSIKKTLKKAFLEDEELKRMMQGIEEHRLLRFLLVGRTAV